MAREIHEREDLLRDARALVPRALLRVKLAGAESEVFIGLRGKSLSLYFGDDPVLPPLPPRGGRSRRGTSVS